MMKLKQIITCLIFGSLVVLMAVQQKPGFVIEGYVDAPKEGTMLLITLNASDTFARAPIVDGRFRLTGSVDSIIEAALIPEGCTMGSLPLFLENSENKFEVYYNRTNDIFSSKVTGGGIQDIAAKFLSLSLGFRIKMDAVAKDIQRAQQDGQQEDLERAARRYGQLKVQARRGEDSLLNVYKDTYVAAYLLFTRSRHDLDLLKAESRVLGPNAWNTTYGKYIKSMLTQYEKLKVGETAPDFFAYTPDGESVSLYDVKGKVKLLYFWASWSGDCQKEGSKLLKLYDEFHDKGLEIVGFSMDLSEKRWLGALEREQYPWIQLIDKKNQGKASDLYVVTSVPNILLLDEDNKIVGRNLQDEVLQAELEKRLGK